MLQSSYMSGKICQVAWKRFLRPSKVVWKLLNPTFPQDTGRKLNVHTVSRAFYLAGIHTRHWNKPGIFMEHLWATAFEGNEVLPNYYDSC